MGRARNKVIEGAHKGKQVAHSGVNPYIILRIAEPLPLDSSTIQHMEMIDSSSDISVASAATRGFIGEMLFGPIGLAAVGTADRDERYILGIVFRNEERSVIEVNGDLFQLITASIREWDQEPDL